MMKTIMFNYKTRLEFNNDGDVCEVIGNRSVRGKYLILYRSIKTNKNYSDTRENMAEWYNKGILKINSKN